MTIKKTQTVTHARSVVTRFDDVVFKSKHYERIQHTTTVTTPDGKKTTKKVSWRLILPKSKESRYRTVKPLNAKEAKSIGLEAAFTSLP